jgi:hypothetical protein
MITPQYVGKTAVVANDEKAVKMILKKIMMIIFSTMVN